MFTSQTKLDLMIEVWEKLDCESVGAEEIHAIEIVLRDELGSQAVDSPMIIARELADEGAELRHAEILKLDVERRTESPYDPMFRNILKIETFAQTISSIRNLENLRKKLTSENDKKGLRMHKQFGLKAKTSAAEIASDLRKPLDERQRNFEIAEWFRIYLQSPEVFEHWVKVRQNSKDFKEKFSHHSKK